MPTDLSATAPTPRSYGSLARQGAAWTVLRQVMSLLIQVPTAVVMARLLTPTEFGVAVAATLVVQFGSRVTQFGLNAAIVRQPELTRVHETSVFVFNVVTGVGMWLGLTLAAPWFGSFFGSAEAGRLIPVAALVFVITPLGTVPGSLLVRQLRYRELSTLAFVDTLVGSVTSISLALVGFSFWSIPCGALMATLVFTLRQYRLARWRIGFGFSWRAFKELLRFGGGVQSTRVIQYVAANLDSLAVGRVLGVTALGFYDKGFSTMNRFIEPLAFGTSVTFRVLAAIRGESVRFRVAYQKTMTVAGVTTIPLFVGAMIIAEELFVVAYGAQWMSSVRVFQFLCIGGICRVLSRYVGNAGEAIGCVWRQVTGQVFSLVVLALCVLVGVRFGSEGAAAGLSAGAVVDLTIATTVLVASTDLSWKDVLRPYLAPLQCAAGLVAVLLLTRALVASAWPGGPIVLLSIASVVGAAYYVAFLLFCRDALYRSAAEDFAGDLFSYLPARLGGWLATHFGRVQHGSF